MENLDDTLINHGADQGVLKKMLYEMMLIRRFEEKSAEMYTKSRIRGFLHLYIGEEAIAVGVINHLVAADNLLTTYREHGHALARGIEAKKIMAEMFGKTEGCCKGRGGSMHLFDKSLNFFGGNAIVGGHLPLAVGMALAAKKQNQSKITCCFFGEGAVAEGEFHESMNLAALWKIPLLMVCENNLYAMGTVISHTHSMQSLEKKGAAYGIESAAVDGMNVMAVWEAARYATERIKETGQPYFLVCNTYRYRAHSMFDAELYRNKSEVEEWKKRDPVASFRALMLNERIITENELNDTEAKIENEINAAVEYAENGTDEPLSQLLQYTYTNQ